MPATLVALDEAVDLVPDGCRLGVGGVLLTRKPMAFLAALADAGRRDLHLFSFLASLDAEVLAAAGALAEVHAGYVGLEQFGFAPAYQAAVGAGRVRRREYSEFVFVAGLRAAVAGLPFMPTRGAFGSDLVAEAGLAEIRCPYTGQPVLAVPALRPDVTVLHAEAADERGNVWGPAHPDFLYDFDATLARASARVVVTVERLVTRRETVRDSRRTLLFGFEVDAVVLLPGGARPTGVPGCYPARLGDIADYIAAPGAGVRAMVAR